MHCADVDDVCSFPDSSPDPAEADQPMAPPQQPLPAGVNSAGHAPMPKHGDHRTSLVLRHQLPHARDRLQKLQEVGGKLPIGPPQQSRRKWQLKASAQVTDALPDATLDCSHGNTL